MRALPLLAVLLLAACGGATPSQPAGGTHGAHDPQTERVKSALAEEFDMAFEPAGPHHELGEAPDGVEMDLVGEPVEQVVLSVPEDDVEAGLAYLPHLRDLLHGPARVYEWAADALGCRAAGDGGCEDRFEQGNLEARFSDGGPGFVVLNLSRGQ